MKGSFLCYLIKILTFPRILSFTVVDVYTITPARFDPLILACL